MVDSRKPVSVDLSLFTSSYGDSLRQLRGRQKMSARHLADVSGVDHSTISRLENEEREPGLKTAVKIAIGLGLPPAERILLYESSVGKSYRRDIRERRSDRRNPPGRPTSY